MEPQGPKNNYSKNAIELNDLFTVPEKKIKALPLMENKKAPKYKE